MNAQDRINRALDFYYTLEMREEPMSDDEVIEEIIDILEGRDE